MVPDIQRRLAQGFAASTCLFFTVLIAAQETPPRKEAAGQPLVEVKPIDLDPWCNRSLDRDFGTRPGNNLKSLPRGKQTLAGVEFVVGDRFMHLASKRAADMPEAIENISIGGDVRKIHVLHATSWGTSAERGTQIGALVLHHGSGETSRIPLLYNIDVQDWWDYGRGTELQNGREAWKGTNEAATEWANLSVRLFRSDWDNPRPGDTIESIDYVSTNETTCAPFMVAMTVERTPPKRSPVIEKLKELHAGLEYQNDRLISVAIAGPNSGGPERSTDEAAALVGELGQLEKIYADNGSFTDEGVRSMTKVRGLKSLSLNGSGVSDEGLKAIGSIKTLERLYLHKAHFTDAGLKHLGGLENLRVLDLSNTAVTDAGLEALGTLNRIERVDLRHTAVSQEAKESFAARYPRGTIKF